MNPILVASDGTSGSDGAVRFATSLAEATSRPLHVLAVHDPVALQVFSEHPSIPQGYALQQSQETDDLRNAVAKQLSRFDPDGRWSVVMEIGRPAVAIAAHAHKVDAKM